MENTMTDKTFTFTIEQIKDIYRAGIHRGQEEATAFEWGSSPTSKEFDELEEAIHTIVNEGKAWDQEGYIDIFTIEKWFREKK
jgi:hypothetical protein